MTVVGNQMKGKESEISLGLEVPGRIPGVVSLFSLKSRETIHPRLLSGLRAEGGGHIPRRAALQGSGDQVVDFIFFYLFFPQYLFMYLSRELF